MRQYIRHPSGVPIEFDRVEPPLHEARCLSNISIGGLCFHANKSVETDAIIHIRIPVTQPEFEAMGRVVWCRKNHTQYEIGVEFLDRDEAYSARIVEQVCHIEHYKQQVLKDEGRELTSEQAAREWIGKYARTFPGATD